MTTLRPRRLRRNPILRAMTRETHLQVADLIQPIFVKEGLTANAPISTMPGQSQLALNRLADEVRGIADLGIPAVLLFGIPRVKTSQAEASYAADGIVPRALKVIKDAAPNLLVITDLCFCSYTDHGHCGIVNDRTGRMDLDDDATLALLQKQAIVHAQAGSDVVAPSGMVDGMVRTIRAGLDGENLQHIPILSYSAKFASGLYGPFREAAQGAPQYGDRATYQLDPANAREAMRESALDHAEGADMLMVKPASAYLDIIYQTKQRFPELPLAAYHVGGEYVMVKAAAERGWIDEQRVMMEVLTGIKRAGADMIITYAAKDVARWIQN